MSGCDSDPESTVVLALALADAAPPPPGSTKKRSVFPLRKQQA